MKQLKTKTNQAIQRNNLAGIFSDTGKIWHICSNCFHSEHTLQSWCPNIFKYTVLKYIQNFRNYDETIVFQEKKRLPYVTAWCIWQKQPREWSDACAPDISLVSQGYSNISKNTEYQREVEVY